MGPRQETIDESILPIRSSQKKRGKRQGGTKFIVDIRKNITIISYIALALFSFTVFFLVKLPLNRMSGHILQILSSQTQMDWDAAQVDVSVIFGPKITFHNLSVNPRYQVPSTDLFSRLVGDGLTVERLSFRPNLWQLLPVPYLKVSQPAGSFSAKLYDGSLSGSFIAGTQMLYVDVSLSDMNFKKVPQLAQQLNIDGNISDLHFELSAPRARLGIASGEVRILADKLKFDVAQLSQASFVKAIGSVQLGKLNARAKIRNGQLNITELNVGGKDSDLELRLEGDIKLSDEVLRSDLNLVLWLTPGAKLNPLFENPLLTSLVPFDKKPNNSYALRLQGNFFQPMASPYKGG